MAGRSDAFPSAQTTSGFGFGVRPSESTGFLFENVAKTTGTAFPSFGTSITSTPSFGSTTGFGNLAVGTPSTSGFSFGLGTTTTSSGLSFGTLGSTSIAPSSSFSFGGLGGTTTTTTPSLGTGFGFGQTGTFGAGGSGLLFGGSTGAPALGGLGAPCPNPPGNTVANIAMALSLPVIFGDERDAILAKWNQLQAFWGTGKGYFANNAPPVEFIPDNPFCRFKAIGYNCIPPWKPEDGLIGLTFNKKESYIRNQQQQMADSLHRLFGSKPTVSVCVEGIKPLPDDKAEVVIYLVERSQIGIARRISSPELIGYLEQPTVKTQLASMDVIGLCTKAAPTKAQLKQYLDTPPAGIDPTLWRQAKLDNPEPEKLIPVPMIGFNELKRRLKYEEHETIQHQERLDTIAEDIAELQRCHATTMAKISEHKRKQIELAHRVLKIMAYQEVVRKYGFAIQADEEQLRVQLEAIQAELNAPTQFKGRLKELLSQIRMRFQGGAVRGEMERYSVDATLQEEIKLYLQNQQDGISHLIRILKDDMEDLKIIEEGLKENIDRRR